DQTIILDSVVRTSGSRPLIILNTTAGKFLRLSGITFRTGTTSITNGNGMIQVSGNSQATRIDNCHFDDLAYEAPNIQTFDYCVIDHNLFDFKTRGQQSVFCTYPDTFWGDVAWTLPARFGSNQFVFVEDNCFNNTISGGFGGGLDGNRGGRYVFRHNHIYNCDGIVACHGTEIGRYRSHRAVESYNNDFHYTFSPNIGGIRGGSFITHDN